MQSPRHFKGHLIVLSGRTQHKFLAISVPLLPSRSLLQELTNLVISRQESFNHIFPPLLLLLKFLTTPFNGTSFSSRPQTYCRLKTHFSSNEARNKVSLIFVPRLQTVTVPMEHFSLLYIFCKSHVLNPYLYTAS